MSTLGSAPSFNSWRWSDSGTSCGTAPDQTQTGNYTMPTAGWVTGITFYADGDSGGATLTGVVWNSSNSVLGTASGVAVSSVGRGLSIQHWHTGAAGFFLPKSQVIRVGFTKPTGSTMSWSENGSSGANWGYNGTPTGSFSGCGAVGAIGAYIDYIAISNPNSTTTAATSVGSTTATLNGTVGDGGQHGSGDPNHSKYYFQYGTDPGLAGATNTSQINFDGTGQAASAAVISLTVNTTYYFRVVSINDAGTVNGSILSFSTLGLPNAPTLNTPTDGSAVNAQTGSVTFAWTYNTGGAGGGETNYALKLVASGVSAWWNGTTLVFVETYVAEATTKTIAAGIIPAGVTVSWTVSSQDANGKGPYASPSLTLISESPPNAPTLGLPSNGSYADMAGATPTFSWTYNPSNGVGGQTNFAIRQKISGGGTFQYYNVGTSSWQGTIVWNAGTIGSFTFPTGKWVDGNVYNWSVATQDAGGQGPFAADFTVTAQAVPVVTALTPSGSISSSKPAVTWSTAFPGGAGETSYQVRTFTAAQYGAGGFNPATSPATDDSGVVSSGSAVSYQVATSLPVGSNFRSYIQITETGAEASGFLAFASYTVVLDLPAAPTIVATAATDPITGCPMVQITSQGNLNLLSSVDGSFETGVGTWVATTNCSVAQSNTQALDGTFSLRMSSTAAGNMASSSGQYAVLPSTQYSALANLRAGATGRTSTVGIAWYDASHTIISTSTGTGVADLTTGWTQLSVTATSPVNAAFALIIVTVQAPAAGAELHYVDEVGIFPGTVAIWTAGGFLATAGIVILRSDGIYVRNASPLNPADIDNTTQGPVIVNDYEVTPLTGYTYQALVQATGAQGQVQSLYSIPDGASVSTTRWWQLDPTNPSSAVSAQPIQFNPSNTEQSTAHQVLGQQTMNIIASAMMLTDMTAVIELFDAVTFAGFMALLTGQKTVFFSDPYGYSYYFRIAPGPGGMSSGMGNKAHDTQLLPSSAGGPHRTINITGVAQPRPAV